MIGKTRPNNSLATQVVLVIVSHHSNSDSETNKMYVDINACCKSQDLQEFETLVPKSRKTMHGGTGIFKYLLWWGGDSIP